MVRKPNDQPGWPRAERSSAGSGELAGAVAADEPRRIGPLRVLVLHGGDSPERDVSLASGARAAEALAEAGHDVRLADPAAAPLEAMDFAAIDASSISSGLPPGLLTLGDWFAVMPYADTIQLCTLTGHQLEQLLHENAHRVDRPDEVHLERGFLHFSAAVRYRIRLGASREEARAVDITVNGEPLCHQRERTFIMACPSFTHALANSWEETVRNSLRLTFNAHTLPKKDTHRLVRNELIAYIRAHGGVTAESGARRDGRLIVDWD